MIFLANILTLCSLIALGILFRNMQWQWGDAFITTFCLGWIVATIMWQVAHRLRYGHWFDPPVLSAPPAKPAIVPTPPGDWAKAGKALAPKDPTRAR